MIEIIAMIIFFVLGVWFGVWVYKIGRKHGIVIGQAQLVKEIEEILNEDCRKAYEDGYSRGHSDGVYEEKSRL